jgi:hypothetical protein
MLQVTMINLNIILIKQLQNAFKSFAVIGEWDKVITVSNDLEKACFTIERLSILLRCRFQYRTLKKVMKLLTYLHLSSIYSSFYSNRFQLTGADRDLLLGH